MAEEKQLPAAVSVLSSISERLKDSGDAVRDKVIEGRVQAEISKRAGALEKALDARSTADKELKKLEKFDVKIHSKDGGVAHEGFSPERMKQIEQARGKLNKIDKAIEAALTNNEWGKLNEIK